MPLAARAGFNYRRQLNGVSFGLVDYLVVAGGGAGGQIWGGGAG